MSVEHVDTLIIGGGAIGAAIARARAADSDSVLVLERDQIGRGASFGNTGHLTPSDAWPLAAPGVVREALAFAFRKDVPFSMEKRLKYGYLRWLASFAWRARRTLPQRIAGLWELGTLSNRLAREISAAADTPPIVQDQGVVNLYTTEQGFAAGRAATEKLIREGVDAQILSAEDAAQRTGFRGGLAGGVLFPTDALCHPVAYVDELVRQARKRGAEFREGVSVLSLRIDGAADRVFVETSVGTIVAESVVLAAGVESVRLAAPFGRRIPIIPGQGYSIEAAVDPAPSMPVLFPELRFAASPFDGVVRFAGIMDLTTEVRPGREERAAYLEAKAREAFPPGTRFELRSTWSGTRACTPDGLPIIDAVDPGGRVILASGHNMLGMTLAAATGHVVASRLAGVDSGVDERPFSLGRFR